MQIYWGAMPTKSAFFLVTISISGIIISLPILIFQKFFPDCFYTCFLSAVILLFVLENWNLLEDLHKDAAIQQHTEAQNKSLIITNSELRTGNLTVIRLKEENTLLVNTNATILRQMMELTAVNASLILINETLSLNLNKINLKHQNTKLKVIKRSTSAEKLDQLPQSNFCDTLLTKTEFALHSTPLTVECDGAR